MEKIKAIGNEVTGDMFQLHTAYLKHDISLQNFFPFFLPNKGHCGQVGTFVKQLGPRVSEIKVSAE